MSSTGPPLSSTPPRARRRTATTSPVPPSTGGASFNTQGFDWWWVGGLGDATLAIVPNGLPAADVASIRQAFVTFADNRLSAMANQGYPAPISAYSWGSDGNIANNANVMAMAYDFTGQAKYRNGVYQTLDYLMGRNPINRSCIAGYGENNTGFTGSITLTNTSSTAWTSWTLRFVFAGNQAITQGWSRTFSQSGTAVTVTNLSWNANVPPGGSTSLGFNASYSGTNANPTSFTINGVACGA
jgi:hypothetical protein